MTITLQLVLDCADPHAQARFWAAALGYEVERNEDLIEKMLAAGFATEADVVTVGGRLEWKEAAACRDPEGQRSRLYFQLVPEPKATKNRFHLDLQIGAADRAGEVERLAALGARWLYEGVQGPHTWVTMADPEGNEFCVA